MFRKSRSQIVFRTDIFWQLRLDAVKGSFSNDGGDGNHGPVARSMASVNQRLIPWQRIDFDTA